MYRPTRGQSHRQQVAAKRAPAYAPTTTSPYVRRIIDAQHACQRTPVGIMAVR